MIGRGYSSEGMDLPSQYLRTVEGAYMDEISESLALLHSIGMKIMEPSNDSGSVFARMINVTLRGWYEGKVAMKGKGVSKGSTNSGQAYVAREFAPSKGWHKRSRKGRFAQI